MLALALVVGVLAGVYPGHSVTADGGRHGMEENVEMPLQVGEKMVVVRMFEDGGMAAVDSVMENGEERRTEVRFEELEEKLGEWRKEKRDTRLLDYLGGAGGGTGDDRARSGYRPQGWIDRSCGQLGNEFGGADGTAV